MDQEITVATNIVKFFYDNIKPSLDVTHAQRCFGFLKQNFLTLDKDKNHFQNIVKQIDGLPADREREELKKNFIDFMVLRGKTIDYKFNDVDSVLNLAEASVDKIYFDCDISDKDISNHLYKTKNDRPEFKTNYKYPKDLEVHNINSFLDPSLAYKLKHIPTHMKITKRDEYDLIDILRPFLRNEQEIKFIDPYIRNSRARINLIRIFDIIKIDARVLIKTLPENEIEDKRKIELFNELLGRRKNASIEEFQIETKTKSTGEQYRKLGHKERYIITDRFRIYIPGGLDQFNEEGLPSLNEDEEMDIHIEKRQ